MPCSPTSFHLINLLSQKLEKIHFIRETPWPSARSREFEALWRANLLKKIFEILNKITLWHILAKQKILWTNWKYPNLYYYLVPIVPETTLDSYVIFGPQTDADTRTSVTENEQFQPLAFDAEGHAVSQKESHGQLFKGETIKLL